MYFSDCKVLLPGPPWDIYAVVSPFSLFYLWLDHILQSLPGQKPPQVLGNQRLGALWPATSGMRADDTVVDFPQLRVTRQRLLVKHIERGPANLVFRQRLEQGLLVDAAATADIDDPCVVGQLSQPLLVQRVLGALIAGQDHDQRVRRLEHLGQLVLAVDLVAVAHAGLPGHPAHGGAKGDEPGRELLGDVAKAPDGDGGVAQGGELVAGAVGLRAAQVLGPLALQLVVAHLVESPGRGQEEAQGVLGDGVVVEPGAGADMDGRVKASGEDVVGPGGAGLDPFEILHALGGVGEVGR